MLNVSLLPHQDHFLMKCSTCGEMLGKAKSEREARFAVGSVKHDCKPIALLGEEFDCEV